MKFLITILHLAVILTAISQPTAPILRIETGMHSASVMGLSTDAFGKYLLTCSDDKTARLWQVATGKLLNTLRIPIGNTNEGRLYTCALSADGKIAALSGYTGYDWDKTLCIYIINTQTGILINRIKGLPEVPMDLEFSPDGKFLAAGLDGKSGVWIFDTSSWELYIKLDGYMGMARDMVFKSDGGLITGSYDGKIRVYNNHFKILVEKGNLAGEKIFSISFNAKNNLIAVGYTDVSTIDVRDGTDLSLLYNPAITETEKVKGVLESICFSDDGSKLYGAGLFIKQVSNSNWKYVLRCWENAGKGSYSDLLFLNNAVLNIKPLADGSIALVSGYPDIAIINSANKITWHLTAESNNYATTDKSHFRINYTSTLVGFTSYLSSAKSFDISERKLIDEQSSNSSPVSSNAGSIVTDFNYNSNPAINGKKIDISTGNMAYSTDVSSDGKKIIIGTGWNLCLFKENVEKIWETALPAAGFATNISGNDKVVIVAVGDGTIRWHNMQDGKELLTFYLHADKKRWVLFTPSGYYDASPGAEDLLGWHINNGPDKAPSFFPVSRFKKEYYRPDIIDKILETYNEQDAVALANQGSKKITATNQSNILQKLPPTVTILSPINGSNTGNNLVTISYTVSSPQNAQTKKIKVLVDGRPIATERGVEGEINNDIEQKIKVSIPSQDCIITLLAENDNGISPEANLNIKWAKAVANDEFIYKPKLYVLAIGVSDYNNADLKLGFAAKDAGDFASTVAKQKGNLYSDVVIKTLINKDATKDGITDGFEWIQKQTGQKDVAMIFYAGHGVNDNNGIFYMLPVGADINRIRTTCLNFEELKQTVSSIAGKVVVFIDACHSGNVMGVRRGETDINALINELSSTENGAITFTSSTGKEFSLEDKSWGNGAFTKAVIEGLNGKAVLNNKNKITVKSLDAYVSERVKELTKGNQHPTSVSPVNVPDFPIAVIK